MLHSYYMLAYMDNILKLNAGQGLSLSRHEFFTTLNAFVLRFELDTVRSYKLNHIASTFLVSVSSQSSIIYLQLKRRHKFFANGTFVSQSHAQDLKLKFKKEEIINGTLINKAMLDPKQFNIEELKWQLEAEEEERKKLRSMSKAYIEKKIKEPKKKKAHTKALPFVY
uniref:Uncharacterized protein n=1 Tax=Glossina austeni TaxID=7395 RepID=A0A1A9V1E9_GLOAU